MKSYVRFVKKTPREIILESEEDIKKGKLMRERKVTIDLRNYKDFLESSGLAPMSVKGRLTGVRSFYKYYDIILPSLPRSATIAVPRRENKAIPKKEDIREILSVADPLEKALVLTGVSSGLSANEISNLKVQEFFDGYDKQDEITTLHLIREKVNYEFYTFLSPEASRAIWEYIKVRSKTSDTKDKIRQDAMAKQKIAYDKNGKAIGYLFVNRYIEPEFLELEDRIKAEEVRKLESKNIQKIYRDLSERANKTSPSDRWNVLRSHNMRKFFDTTLLSNGADIFTTDFMMGHRIDKTKDAYFIADPKALKEKYKQYIPYLTIQQELSVDDSPEFQRLKTENQNFATSLAKATVEKDEIINLRNELEELKKKKEEASGISKEFLLSALQDPEIQEILRSSSK